MNIMEGSKQDPNQTVGNKFLRLGKSRRAAVVFVMNKAFFFSNIWFSRAVFCTEQFRCGYTIVFRMFLAILSFHQN